MASVDQPYFIIAGDFNSLDTKFLETEYGMCLITNSITHGKRILDKLFISWPSAYIVQVVKSLLKTKHKAVTARAVCELDSGCSSRKTVHVYDKRQHNIDKLRHAIAIYDWTLMNNCSSVSDTYSQFLNVVSDLINKCIPKNT